MRFHVLGIPHTISDPEWSACAFTTKAMKFCKMMSSEHTVFHYGHELSKVICTEHVTVVDQEIFNEVYGSHDWKHKLFKYDLNDKCYTTFYDNAIKEISKRFQPYDFVLLFWGWGHKKIADGLRDLKLAKIIFVEPGIGYPLGGIDVLNHHVYESYSIMNRHLGWLEKAGKNSAPKCYDVVIPNYFDPNEFEIDTPGDYFVYIGRIVHEKGVYIAIDITKRCGEKLIVAGQGSLDKEYDHVQHIGYVNVEARKKLLKNAKGLFCPSFYNEPFGGIAVEAMMSGVPVITTDWGAFPETVQHGVTGYRCRNMDHFNWAVKNIDKIDRNKCRQWAIDNYSINRIKLMYEEYFSMLIDLYEGGGFYHVSNDRENLDWLIRYT